MVVNPESTSTLEVVGDGKTRLELNIDARSVVIVDEKGERTFGPDRSLGMSFPDRKKITFRNEHKKAVTIRYRAVSAGGVSTSIEQR